MTILDLEQIVRGEYAENFFRKSFTPSEYADIADELEPLERQAAKERQKEHGGTAPAAKLLGKFPTAVDRRPSTTLPVQSARIARRSPRRVRCAMQPWLSRNASASSPRTWTAPAASMGRIKRLNIARQAEAIRAEPPPFPERGPYRVIAVDVPWPYDQDRDDPADRATYSFPQMSIAAICAMGPKVRAIAHEDCILWFWITNFHLIARRLHRS